MEVYFTHQYPYSSWKREINENHNKMIHRMKDWMNHLPRKLSGYATPRECLLNELAKLSLVAR